MNLSLRATTLNGRCDWIVLTTTKHLASERFLACVAAVRGSCGGGDGGGGGGAAAAASLGAAAAAGGGGGGDGHGFMALYSKKQQQRQQQERRGVGSGVANPRGGVLRCGTEPSRPRSSLEVEGVGWT